VPTPCSTERGLSYTPSFHLLRSPDKTQPRTSAEHVRSDALRHFCRVAVGGFKIILHGFICPQGFGKANCRLGMGAGVVRQEALFFKPWRASRKAVECRGLGRASWQPNTEYRICPAAFISVSSTPAPDATELTKYNSSCETSRVTAIPRI
jgi:hypothetical protein